MSGFLPPTSTGAPSRAETGQTSDRQWTANPQDVYRGSAAPRELQEPPALNRPVSGAYRQAHHDTTMQALPRPDATLARPAFGPHGHASEGQSLLSQPYYPTVPGSSLSYAGSSTPRPAENQPYASPKAHRKTKGHVASACVPCKKAHLRCDSQRPCARCASNGKEDACVDVQHKKRGRPRLRDDREPRFDAARTAHPHDAGMRRPMPTYPGPGPVPIAYEDPSRRNQAYRVLKSQPSESGPPRHWARGSASDANIHAAPLTIATRPPEPVIYLTLDLEIVRASPTFTDVLGGGDLSGRKLLDIIAPPDRERVHRLASRLNEDQKKEQPNYLPPILDRGPQILQSLGMAAVDVGRYKLEHQEHLNLICMDRSTRPCYMRFGLAKEASFYFLVALLSPPPTGRYPYPSPTAHPREGPAPFQRQPRTPQPVMMQHAPVPTAVDHTRNYVGEPHQSGRLSVGSSSYTATPTRPDFPGPSPALAMPRHAPSALPRAPEAASYQLPPIRTPFPGSHPSPAAGESPIYSHHARRGAYDTRRGEEQSRSERPSGRVDIGGLIDHPDDTSHSR